ncbi:hypothetical protein X750_28295 [Mesorhizobium sp. LNJC394B00]|nr:hypothetical protein X750_28295 [Mesorhizobium sp. LNJC394B00]
MLWFLTILDVYRRIHVLPPIGKQKRHPALDYVFDLNRDGLNLALASLTSTSEGGTSQQLKKMGAGF